MERQSITVRADYMLGTLHPHIQDSSGILQAVPAVGGQTFSKVMWKSIKQTRSYHTDNRAKHAGTSDRKDMLEKLIVLSHWEGTASVFISWSGCFILIWVYIQLTRTCIQKTRAYFQRQEECRSECSINYMPHNTIPCIKTCPRTHKCTVTHVDKDPFRLPVKDTKCSTKHSKMEKFNVNRKVILYWLDTNDGEQGFPPY